MHVCRIDTTARTTNRSCAATHARITPDEVVLGASARISVDARTQFTHLEEHWDPYEASVRAKSWRGFRATQIRHHRFDSRILTQRRGAWVKLAKANWVRQPTTKRNPADRVKSG